MSLISLASINSEWRGYDYFKRGKVDSYTKVGDGIYQGKIKGSGDVIYDVHIDVNHPRSSKCNCPFADGTRKICKHMVALCFTVLPDELEKYEEELKEEERAEQEEEERLMKLEERLVEYIDSLSKEQMRNILYDIFTDILDEGDEWKVENFIGGFGDDYYDDDEDYECDFDDEDEW